MKSHYTLRSFIVGTLLVLGSVLLMSACSSHKKKKCNTCPKWTSQSIEHEQILRAA